ncbi:MAG: alpha-L-fucosidase [Sphingomonas sp.]|nr:alpha-L-fucosidase [Sphingomonas sp.]
MKRRTFCTLLGSSLTAAALPFKTGSARAASVPPGFNRLGQTYAEFCATGEQQRLFYALRGTQVVSERLDQASWKEPGWGWPADAQMPPGWWNGVPLDAPVPGLSGPGPFQPTWESLDQYECPDWYRDAKFGIWNHWSPQCVPEDGDWYARNVYVEDQPQHRYHLEHYGHPSRFGYKDLCAQWTLLNWQPEQLMDLYSRAGARLFMALANHHDGFDTWNSAHHPWNAQNLGPRRDVIGTWAKLARERGLKFGVTVHQARNWWWFQVAHGADRTGPFAGIPYDGLLTLADGKGQWWEGLDPQRLYGPKHPSDALPDASYVKNFYDRTRDLIDQHDPDLLYFDDSLLPLGWAGMAIGAYFYNHRLARHGSADSVLNIKDVPANLRKAVVADIERGLSSEILPHPWQSETCIGEWHYQRRLFEQPGEYGGYLHPGDAIHWMADTVSKNGTFILNIPGRPDGTIDSKEQLILEEIGAWLKINGEAIYATRPWKIYGEGPVEIKQGSFQGDSIKRVTAKDIRYTRNKAGTIVYAISLGWPERPMELRSLGTAASTRPGRVEHVELLGTSKRPKWNQTASALHVTLPDFRPAAEHAAALKIYVS